MDNHELWILLKGSLEEMNHKEQMRRGRRNQAVVLARGSVSRMAIRIMHTL